MRGDRQAAIDSVGLSFDAAMAREFELGQAALSAETWAGAVRFSGGAGRHGEADKK
jgi:enoyl-CoA hydratase